MPGVPTTYSELQTSILGWMDDASPQLVAAIPEIIGVTERRLSRKLNTPEMEGSTSLAVVDGVASLPDDFMELRAAYIGYDGYRTPLNAMSPADFNQWFSSDNLGRPQHFAISGQNMMLRPLPDLDYAVFISYKQVLPYLSDDNPTNWLLTKWPDLYIAACIVTAAAYGFEDQRLPLVSSNAEVLLDEVNETGQKARHTAGPLVMRAPVGDFRPRTGGYARGGYLPSFLEDNYGGQLEDG